MEPLSYPAVQSLIFIISSCVILYAAKYTFNWFSLFSIDSQVRQNGYTPAIAFSGYFLGLIIVLTGAYLGPSLPSFLSDWLYFLSYALIGLVLMCVSGFLVDKVLLNQFECKQELLRDRNIGTAGVYFGAYVASGLIIAGSVNGEYGGIPLTLMYYALGMFFMYAFIKVYDYLVPYSLHKEIERDNYAVGIALGGNLIAIGILLMRATLYSSAEPYDCLFNYLSELLTVFLVLPFFRFVLGNWVVRNINFNKELQNNNVAAGLIEFISIIGFAVLIAAMFHVSDV